MASHVRHASDTDLGALAAIEAAADTVFSTVMPNAIWEAPPAGTSRREHPGYVLVVAEQDDGAPVGFAHVIEHDGHGHLEQVSVHPAHARQGHGRALIEAALDEAEERGLTDMSLRTFADVPWNAPFYASLGFAEAPVPDDAFHRALTEAEERLGLSELGRRVHMEIDLSGGMEMSTADFEALVVEELDRLPDEMVDDLENVVFVVEDDNAEEELFGLYEGLALTERGQYGMGELPDRIVVYRGPHLRACRDEAALRAEVHTTLVHEIAHFYGIDDEHLHELGWA